MRDEEFLAAARIAWLKLRQEEIERLSTAVSQMLEYFEKMDTLDVDELELTTHALYRRNRLREDRARQEDVSRSLLENAPVIPNVL